MVLENFLSIKVIRKFPQIMFVEGLVLASAAIWLSNWVFPSNSSLLHIAFAVIASMPTITKLFVLEESIEAKKPGKAAGFLSRHRNLISIYAWFFLGLVFAYSLWYFALPEEETILCLSTDSICFGLPVRGGVFEEQENTLGAISDLKSSIDGSSTLNLTGNLLAEGCKDFYTYLFLIFENNSIVLLLAIIFSLVYGAGALFLIAWNASIIGVKIGQDAIASIPLYSSQYGILSIFPAFIHGLINAIGLVPHGIFEITGFFVGAIAGGILSVAITKKSLKEKDELKLILKDAVAISLMAFALIFIGAFIEAYFISINC